nr:MAG TPA: hypothetical protein [Caudoviricetes sp.]
MGNNGFFQIPTFSGYVSQNSRAATAALERRDICLFL